MLLASKKIRYWKYQYISWTQPILSSNTTSTQYGDIVVSASNESQPAYRAFDGIKSGSSEDGQWTAGNYSKGWLQIKFPYKLKITNIDLYNARSNDTSCNVIKGAFYTDNTLTTQIGNTLSTPTTNWYKTNAYNGSGIITDTLYLNITGSNNSYIRVGEIEITATQQLIIESDSSDYDYTTINPQYYALGNIDYSYYKYSGTEQINLTDSGNSTYISDGKFLVSSVTAWSTTQTYNLNTSKMTKKLYFSFTNGWVQSNAGWRATITALTNSGNITVLDKDFGYNVEPSGSFEYNFNSNTIIYGIQIYVYCYRRSDQYCYGSIGIIINNDKLVSSDSSNYDYITRNERYFSLARKVTKYWKLEDWSQPVLTSNSTAVTGGIITTSATSNLNSDTAAYKIMLGSTSSTVDVDYWGINNSNDEQSLIINFPYKLKITELSVVTRPRDNYTRNVVAYDENNRQIGNQISTSAALTRYSFLTNSDNKYYITNKIKIVVLVGSGDNKYFGLQNLQITANKATLSDINNYNFVESETQY